MKIENFISPLDSGRFGFKIAKVNDFTLTPLKILSELKKHDVKLVISRVNSKNILLINDLEDLNFRIKDTQLTFSRALKIKESTIKIINHPNSVKIEIANPNDAVTVGKIALKSFKGYGHYSVNKLLDKTKSNEIYEDWAIKSCLDKNVADNMFVAKVNDEIAGFLSLKTMYEGQNVFGVQHLGAVDDKFRNMDIFRQLINKCLRVGIDNNHNWQQTFLQSTNIPVMSSYLKLGFKISDSNHTMHCWI